MSMVVAHNIAAINANKNLYQSNRSLNGSLSKLSSGYRINTGADGPADLVISEQLRSQVNGLERAVRNTTEATNVLGIAEGALNEMNSILKKMKALAIHSASNGVTSPDQVAADQAEMDSGIQTLERIANTTKFSDQFLLNGSKDITYNTTVDQKGTQNNKLVNTGLSNFQQIFKRDGYQVSISFNGTANANAQTNVGDAAMERQASKAYLEIDAYDRTISQIDEDGKLTQGQSFILTGTLGSRQFNFSEGAHISEVVSAIHNVAGSTGVDAALTFNRNQTINLSNEASTAITDVGRVDTVGKGNGVVTVFDNYRVNEQTGEYENIVTDVTNVNGNVVYGKNTDGNGDVFVKVLQNGAYEVYKDASLSAESLIATGLTADNTQMAERNHSDLEFDLTLNANARYGDVVRINLGNVKLDDQSVTVTGTAACGANALFDANTSIAAGVQLGVNTSSDGKIFIKVEYDSTGQAAKVTAYKDKLMREQDKVAETKGGPVDVSEDGSIILDSIWNDEHTANTGLGLKLDMIAANVRTDDTLANQTETMEIQFDNLGARVFSSDYGSDQFVTVQMFEGGLFVNYEDQANYDSAKLVEKNTTFTKHGQDATITVNGQQMKTNGLNLNLATPDIQASMSFNSGKTGSTTLAQVGYGEGTIFTKNTALTLAYDDDGNQDQGSNQANNGNYTGYLNNAGHNTKETVSDFQGGMQLQLGEGSGDQERTVLGIKSMSTAQLGRMEVYQQFDKTKAVWETRSVSIQDVMGGQVASLSSDPTLAMKIIDKAINDVANVRAQIGAVQSNMLTTNENNLRVAIENITKTESAIRDTDMATEMTEFTKNQILNNAGINMLSQANAMAQNVMGLLQ